MRQLEKLMRFAVPVFSAATLLVACSKEQQIIFSVASLHWNAADTEAEKETEQECRKLHRPINAYLEKGWRVVASTAKDRLVINGRGTCRGTEYVIEK